MVDVTSGVAGALSLIMWFMVGAAICAVLFVFAFIKRFKHTIILKDLANDRKIITKSQYRDFIDEDGIPFIQTLKKVAGRRLHPVPPPQCVELQGTGKKWIEAYITETGEIHYIVDNGLKDNQASLEAFTTKQRSILINQYKKAHERKGKRWQDLIVPLVGIGALVIIVVCLLIFYEDMGKPLLAMADKQNAYEAQITKQLEIMDRMDRNIQIIATELDVAPKEPPN